MKLYEELAEYYFAIENHHRDIRKDIQFIKSYIPVGKRAEILDLGCGSGEHIALLARDGYRCVGIDTSAEMLTVARERNGTDVLYEQKNVISFDYFEEFDILYSLFGSIDYLLTDKEIDAMLWNSWRTLRPEGVLILEIWNSYPIIAIGNKELGFVSSTTFGNVVVERERGFVMKQKSPETIVDVNYRYHIHDGLSLRMVEDTHTMRAFSLDEMKLFVARNGFRLKNFYSNTAREGFSETSNRIVLVLEK
jgi:SAM-dependent methyltransferase